MQQGNRALAAERAPPVIEFMAPALAPMFYDRSVDGAVQYACSRYKSAHGGRGSTKSWGIAGQAVISGAHFPTHFACVREVQVSMRASIHKLLASRIDTLGLGRYYDVQAERIVGKYTTRVCGEYKRTLFEFAGIKTDPAKVKGMEGFDVGLCEEAEAYTFAGWTFLRNTIRNAAGNSEFWVSFNPRHREDATSQMFIERPQPGMRVVRINWPDNPWFGGDLRYELNISRRAILEARDESERLQAQADYDHVWMGEYQRLTNANVIRHWVDNEVFDEPAGVQSRYGLDWGYADDPLAGVRFYITDHKDPVTGEKYQELWISHEAFGTHIELNSVKRFLEDRLPGVGQWQVKADCAQPAMISHVKAAGLNIAGAAKWSGSVEDGLAVVNKYRTIHIHARCPNVAREARLYAYKVDPMNPKNVLPIIIDKHNHSWDACIAEGQLVMTARGEVPIELVKTGDQVQTRKGWRRVIATHLVGVKPVLRLNAGPHSLLATADHLVFTNNRGFVQMDALRYNDDLCVNQLSLTGAGTTGIRAKIISLVASLVGLRGCNVLSVQRHLQLTNTKARNAAHVRVQCVEDIGLSVPVYDLAVEGEPEFFASGVLVHNCRYGHDGLIKHRTSFFG